jgi:hypothetical protein
MFSQKKKNSLSMGLTSASKRNSRRRMPKPHISWVLGEKSEFD